MNIPALQATLRQFAADRDWQPLHTPKNLATALMVEASKLAEIFQWLTPEQSWRAHQDAALKPRIADELADVLLYLLQLADHTQCDLQRAVADKLVKNASKHPPLRARALLPVAMAPVLATAPNPAPSVHVLLDFENVQPDQAELRALVPGLTHLWLFHGPHQKDLAQRFAGFGPGLSLVAISKSGKNALDFHLSFYAGYIVSRYPQAAIVVVANDKGYAPMLMHAQTLGFDVRQVGHARVAAAKRASAKRKAAGVAPVAVPRAAPTAVKLAAPVAAAPRKPAARKAPARRPVPATAPAPAVVAPAPASVQARVARKAAPKPAAKRAALALAAVSAAQVSPPPAALPRNAPPALKMVQILVRKAGAGRAPAPLSPALAAAPAPAFAALADLASAATPAPAPTATPSTRPLARPPTAVAPRKLLGSLRKMGDSLPTKQGRLLSTLRSLLGPDADAAEALAALAKLVAAGQVVVAPGGTVSYRL